MLLASLPRKSLEFYFIRHKAYGTLIPAYHVFLASDLELDASLRRLAPI